MSSQDCSVITIDGPSGTGKGTLCRILAKKLGWHRLDSGAIYRVLALAASLNNIGLKDEKTLCDLARTLDLRFVEVEEKALVLLADQDVTQAIRTEDCGQNASKVASISSVRAVLLQRQRDFAKEPGLVCDGRDMGTTVFPRANLKIFLDASAEIRAKRRYKELKEKDISVNLAQVVKELLERDERDRSRQSSPLLPADDAIIIDTSDLTIEEVVQKALSVVTTNLGLQCN